MCATAFKYTVVDPDCSVMLFFNKYSSLLVLFLFANSSTDRIEFQLYDKISNFF